MNHLVVDHGNLGKMTGRLGGDNGGVGANIGVVGRDEEAPLDEIVVAHFPAVTERGEDDQGKDEPLHAARALRVGEGDGRARRAGSHRNPRAGRWNRNAMGGWGGRDHRLLGRRCGNGKILGHGTYPVPAVEPNRSVDG